MSRLTVFDIDDTVFDWLKMWSSSFSQFLITLGRFTGLDDPSVRRTIRTFHQSVGTSEFPFSSDDLKALFSGLGEQEAHALADGLSASRRAGHHLFSGIADLFAALQRNGDTVVLHTDAPSALAAARCEALGIGPLVKRVYATANERFPNRSGVSAAQDVVTIQERKPDPRALQFVIAHSGAAAEETVYIGDSLFRDIAMAKKCAVSDVYAKYGCDRDGNAYNLLRDVSHWTQEDVDTEKLMRQEVVSPSATAVSTEELARILLASRS
jgi:FMN phosphatase YigB (HAD superfamily)